MASPDMEQFIARVRTQVELVQIENELRQGIISPPDHAILKERIVTDLAWLRALQVFVDLEVITPTIAQRIAVAAQGTVLGGVFSNLQ